MKKLVRMATKIFPLAIIVLFLTAGSSFAVPDWSIYDSLFEEDQNTNYLGPGFGGQAYDVERLGMSVADGMLKFALQTGVNILQPASLGFLQPGDLALDIGNDRTFEFGLRFWEQTPSLIAATSWTNVYYTQHSDSNPWRANGSPVAVLADEFDVAKGTMTDDYGNLSYYLEGHIGLSALGLSDFNTPIASNFTMYCGNDSGGTTAAPVPEPTTMILLGTGLLGIGIFSRKKGTNKS